MFQHAPVIAGSIIVFTLGQYAHNIYNGKEVLFFYLVPYYVNLLFL